MKRNSSLDCLRIIATLQTILIHCVSYSIGRSVAIKHILILVYKTCNYNFMMVSSYVAAGSNFRFSKILNLALNVTICNCVLKYIINPFFGYNMLLSYKNIIENIFPISHNKYWYFSPFLFTEVLFSVIYKSLKQNDKIFNVKINCLICLFLFLRKEGLFKSIGISNDFSIAPFIISGFIVSYIKNFMINCSLNKLIFIFFLIYSWNIFNYFMNMDSYLHIFGIRLIFNCEIFGLPSFALSILSLLIFLKIKIFNKYVKIFQTLAEMSMSIYMLHTSQPHMEICWKELRKYKNNSLIFSINALFYTFKIFITNGFISFTLSKFNNILIFRRKFFYELIYKI